MKNVFKDFKKVKYEGPTWDANNKQSKMVSFADTSPTGNIVENNDVIANSGIINM